VDRIMYAVISDRGKQYTVQAGDRVRIDLLDAQPGSEIVFDRVLLVGGDEVRVGRPVVEGASVKGTVLGEHKDRKIVVFKKKRRKNHRRRNGHRQHETVVRITEILTDGKAPSKAAKPKAEAKGAAKPAKASKPETEAPADTAAETVEPAAKSAQTKSGATTAAKSGAKSAAKSGAKADAKTAAPKDKPAAKASEE
jgi:large subunit ribosomal protein L21